MKYLMIKLTCIKDIKTDWNIFYNIEEVHLQIGDIVYSTRKTSFSAKQHQA